MATDFSQFNVSGPAYVWVGLGTMKAFLFLGFTENGLTLSINPYNEDIQVDYAGPNLPGDVSQFGYDMNVSGTFTRYSEIVTQQIISMAGNSALGSTPGSFQNNFMGSLMNLESVAYPLLVYFPYAVAKGVAPDLIFPNQVQGYNFNAAYLNNPYQFVASVKRKAPEFSFRCIPIFGTFSGMTFQANTAPWNGAQIYSNIIPSPLPNID